MLLLLWQVLLRRSCRRWHAAQRLGWQPMRHRGHVAKATTIFWHRHLYVRTYIAPLVVPKGLVMVGKVSFLIHARGYSHPSLVVHPVVFQEDAVVFREALLIVVRNGTFGRRTRPG